MTSVETAVIVDALRTPIGRYGGALKDVRPDDLAALVVREAVQRNALDPAGIEDVFFGDANQAGEDNRNVARMAVLLAGLPVEIPAATMNRLCGSGMQALVAATREIQTGNGNCFLAGGVESMTRAPYILEKPQREFSRCGFSRMYGARVMLSTPPARKQFPLPVWISRVAATTACIPEPHSRFIVAAGISTGSPASRTAMRATFRLSSPAWLASPKKTSSMPAGSSALRWTASRTTSAARSSGRTSLSAPP